MGFRYSCIAAAMLLVVMCDNYKVYGVFWQSKCCCISSREGYCKEQSCWIVDRESCWIETSLILLNSMFNKILINSVCDWCFPLTDLSPVCIVLSYCTVLNCSIILDYHCIETLRTILACLFKNKSLESSIVVVSGCIS